MQKKNPHNLFAPPIIRDASTFVVTDNTESMDAWRDLMSWPKSELAFTCRVPLGTVATPASSKIHSRQMSLSHLGQKVDGPFD